ncbi:hypothetical protein E3N88_23353 [Mikania micrantha]|uniref:Reverse transcriptase RNase H-like domain-containing protein n=1 Tax=Mikania micrantha TaxID=192012 RepID=A0A5N6ND39_9ASTR|nr:hypothetical protein E3N88_23353 [Mikania micrantha]
MTTPNQEFEKALKEHELSLIQLESVAEKNNSELTGIKAAAAERNSSEMAMMNSQMDEILKNLQHLSTGTGRNNLNNDNQYHTNVRDLEDTRLVRSNNQFAKVEFPKFDGTDVEGWLYRCEHFFTIDETPERLKLRYAAVHLEGRALQWHQSYIKTREDAMGALKALTQTDALETYCYSFDLLLNKVVIFEEYVVSLFIEGLKPEIRCYVKIITIADGSKLPCMKLCKDFQWVMQGSWFKADMLISPLSNYDIVLGIHCIKLKWVKMANNEQLESLLQDFSDVFEIPTGLPPVRSCDHKNLLKDENVKLNLKPYRYPTFQKDVIEQMPQEFFFIETDASAKGLGVVLMQDNHPLAFISKALSPTVIIDQQSLKHLLDKKIVIPLQQEWLSKLLGYDYEICYKKGVENLAADALSRVHGLAIFTLAVNSLDPL